MTEIMPNAASLKKIFLFRIEIPITKNFHLFIYTKLNYIISLISVRGRQSVLGTERPGVLLLFFFYSRPCVRRMACCSLIGVINVCPDGCIVILDVPDVIVRNVLE